MLNKLLNKLTHYFLHRAFAQMEVAQVDTANDDVADFCDDYWTYFVRSDND